MRYRHEVWAATIIEELCRKEEGIMRAEKIVTKVSRDYKKFARNMAIMKNSRDRASDIYNARLEGITEGEAKGKEAEKTEIAKKMKKLGDSEKKISAITGLPVEIIEKL